jgi:hypothetical protein
MRCSLTRTTVHSGSQSSACSPTGRSRFEASGTDLSRGVQGFAGRVARRLNKKLKRTGKLFATRFHARAMSSPRDVRNTLRYVLLDRKHHDTTTNFDRYWIDPYSSAPWFDGWAEPIRGASWKHELVARPLRQSGRRRGYSALAGDGTGHCASTHGLRELERRTGCATGRTLLG